MRSEIMDFGKPKARIPIYVKVLQDKAEVSN